MVDIDVQVEVDAVVKALGKLDGEVDKAASRALNDAAKQMKTEVNKQLKDEMNLRNLKHLRKHDTVSKATPTKLVAGVVGGGAAVPLSSVKGSKATKRNGVRGSFGGQTVHVKRGFKWNNTFFKRVGKSRNPIQLITGPTIPTGMLKSAITKAVQVKGQSAFIRRFDYWIDRSLRKLGIR